MTPFEWIIIGLAAGGLIGGLFFGGKESKRQEENLQIEREKAFSQSKAELTAISKDYKNIRDVIIPGVESELRGLDTFFEGYQMEWDQQVGSLELELGRVDSLLGNWQSSYDAQTRSAMSQGKDTLYNLLQNYSISEVVAADRGMGGSMQLVAQQEKQKVIDFAGSDMSLTGGEGVFGAAYASLVANLNAEKDYYTTQRDLIGGGIDLAKYNLESQYEEAVLQKGELEGALGRYYGLLGEYESDYNKQYDATIKAMNKAGLKEHVKTFGEII